MVDESADEEQNKSLIKQANEAAERMEKANAEAREILARQEKLAMQNMLGGRSEAGQTTKVETDDEKWSKEAKVRYAGTGLDPT